MGWILSILNEKKIKLGRFCLSLPLREHWEILRQTFQRIRDYRSLQPEQKELIECVIQGTRNYSKNTLENSCSPFQVLAGVSTRYSSSQCNREQHSCPISPTMFQRWDLCCCISISLCCISGSPPGSENLSVVAVTILASSSSVGFIYLLVYLDHGLVLMTTFTFKICHEYERHLQLGALWGVRNLVEMPLPSRWCFKSWWGTQDVYD